MCRKLAVEKPGMLSLGRWSVGGGRRGAGLLRAVLGPSASRPSSSAALPKDDVLITDAAVHKLRKVGGGSKRLRVTVDGGGCSGFEYKFSLEETSKTPSADDRVFAREGVEVVVDELSLEYMRGASVDYAEELIKSAFRVTANPLAEKGCSCGTSFALRMD